MDHLFYCIHRERLLVSNSLIVLLGFTGATLDDTHDYHNESVSIIKGIREYKKEFTVIHPEIERFYQVFYENIVVTKDGISFEMKNGLHEITSFEQYYNLLWSILSRITDNCQDPGRTIPLSRFTTLSSGYDSTAVTCLAKQLGVETCFTVKNQPPGCGGLQSIRQMMAPWPHSSSTSMSSMSMPLPPASRRTNSSSYQPIMGNREQYAVLNEIAFSSMVYLYRTTLFSSCLIYRLPW